MKNAFLHNLLKTMLVAAIAVSATVGCSKKETKSSGKKDTVYVDGATNVNYDGTGTAPVDSYSQSLLEDYAGRRVNNPKNIRVSLDAWNVSSGSIPQYGGTFKITYEESCSGTSNGCNGSKRTVSGTFNSGASEYDTRYNKTYFTGGIDKVKLFFQDQMGGIIVSIEPIAVNDIETKFKGTVYYRNFDLGVCSKPGFWMYPQCNVQAPQKCWNISAGPYDCRAYLSGDSVRPDIVDLPGFGSKQDGYNGQGYKVLFTFTNMDLGVALDTTL